MSMKPSDAPRKVYLRNGCTHVVIGGQAYGTRSESAIDPKFEAKCAVLENGKLEVVQRKPKKKGVTEMWGKVSVPHKARA